MQTGFVKAYKEKTKFRLWCFFCANVPNLYMKVNNVFAEEPIKGIKRQWVRKLEALCHNINFNSVVLTYTNEAPNEIYLK